MDLSGNDLCFFLPAALLFFAACFLFTEANSSVQYKGGCDTHR